MAFHKKTLKDVALKGKKVLLRADYNVPLDGHGMITDDYRLRQSLPTLLYLLEQGAAVIICSHLGRPDGKDDLSCSLLPVAKRLGELLDRPVSFVPDCTGERALIAADRIQPGEVILLENLRFHPEEEADDDDFARALAGLADLFVQDGFGVVHRKHASTDAITRHLPAVAGLLLEQEVDTLTRVVEAPDKPLVAIVGGAKIADKIGVLRRFIETADIVVVGGAMANTFLQASGVDIAASKTVAADLPLARQILETVANIQKTRDLIFYIPQDGVVATRLDPAARTRVVDWSAHVYAEVEAYPKRPARASGQLLAHEMILDIGPFSGAFIAGAVQLAHTVVWNGTMGVTEVMAMHGPVGPFAHGTDLLVDALLGQYGHKPFTIVGGGDTVGYVASRGLIGSFGHVSTGGGASLELLAGQKLPGIEALQNKK